MKGHSVAAEWQYLDELCHFNVLQSIISSLWNHLQQIGNVTDLTRSGRPPQRNDHRLLVTNALRDRNQNATQLQQQHFFHATRVRRSVITDEASKLEILYRIAQTT